MRLTRVVLVRTQVPGNLGAAARVMRNFGLDDLVLVAPQVDPLDRAALQMSTHGEAILRHARIVPCLADALGDRTLACATSARIGGLFRKQTVGTPRQLMPDLARRLRSEQPIALIFGPEPSGLLDEEISQCQHLVTIPTGDEYPALNLAQAVAICLYELRVAWEPAPSEAPDDPIADLATQERMFDHLRQALEEIHFLFGDKAEVLMHGLRHLLGKAKLSPMEVKLLHGLARQIRWHVRQNQGQSQTPSPHEPKSPED